MFGRLGMYYPLHRAYLDQQGQPVTHADRDPVAIAASQPGDLGIVLRMAGVIAAVCIAIALVSWSAG